MNREAWLTAAAESMRPWFAEHDMDLPATIAASCGWPARGGLARRKKVIGECWKTTVSPEGVSQIFINPMLSDPIEVLATLVHELIHAWDNCEHGHRRVFSRAAEKLGLEAPWTNTTPGEELRERLAGLVERHGPYPHQGMTPTPKDKTQSTRMLKVICAVPVVEGEGVYGIRMTRTWIDDVGTPICPCHNQQMELVDA